MPLFFIKKEKTLILCDEVYRPLTQTDDRCPSIADLYVNGISVSSLSKRLTINGDADQLDDILKRRAAADVNRLLSE